MGLGIGSEHLPLRGEEYDGVGGLIAVPVQDDGSSREKGGIAISQEWQERVGFRIVSEPLLEIGEGPSQAGFAENDEIGRLPA